ncbi:MAG: S9 family peptidase, partial [Xanthomonadales bacterium]|nr:S9 family peptidase [Xanthomonadales bacterium]
WGGKPLVDLQKGLSYAIDNYDFLDGDNACALGASYGGYMMNWVAGAWNDRFKCIVNHDGIFDNRFMSWSTEELWFDEWEHGGPQYEVPENYERHNPVNRLADWQTPMLIIHGAQDFRVPLEQGIAAFTALQRRGIESRFLYFPDENHWVLKPKNSIQWHREVERWLAEHLK